MTKSAYLRTHGEYDVACPCGDLLAIDHTNLVPLAAGTEVWISLAQPGVTLVPN